jgi:hypothetical protein
MLASTPHLVSLFFFYTLFSLFFSLKRSHFVHVTGLDDMMVKTLVKILEKKEDVRVTPVLMNDDHGDNEVDGSEA